MLGEKVASGLHKVKWISYSQGLNGDPPKGTARVSIFDPDTTTWSSQEYPPGAKLPDPPNISPECGSPVRGVTLARLPSGPGRINKVGVLITNDMGAPVPKASVAFSILSGPNVRRSGTETTDVGGNAVFSYTSISSDGTDVVRATYRDAVGTLHSATLSLSAGWFANSFTRPGFQIDNDAIWEYFSRYGGLATFGNPISRAFRLSGFMTQFFQNRIIQLDEHNQPRLLNVLDLDLLPYRKIDGAELPDDDAAFIASAPPATDIQATLQWISSHAADRFNGKQTNFYKTFKETVVGPTRTGGGAMPLLEADLEMWGIPTSEPRANPNNPGVIYQRFERGIMYYDRACNCTRAVPLVESLKSIMTGQNLPADLAREAQASALFRQYDPSSKDWIRNPRLLLDSDLTQAFQPQ